MVKNLTRVSFLIALGIILPTIFHQFGLSGRIFLPMHIPVFLAGMVINWKYGLACGFMLPFLSSVTTGMPPLYPTSVSMAVEMSMYGLISGLLCQSRKNSIYFSLVIAMICGRITAGCANFLMLTTAGNPFLLKAFFYSSFITPIPGILVQVIFIPPLVHAINRISRNENLPETAEREG